VKKKKRSVLLAKVHSATTEVSDAAEALDALLAAIKAAPRAQKTTVSKVVEEAFARLKRARGALTDVEQILTKQADE
jgi:hypothetical protein